MEKSKKFFLILITILLGLFVLTGCNSKNTEKDNKSKINEELNYLDTKIVGIVNKLNNINLQNYTISSQEVSLGQKSSGSSQEGESSSKENSGAQEGSGSGSQQSNPSSKSGSENQSEGSNITTTEMKPDSILELDENDIDWINIKNDIETISEAWAVVILDLSSMNVDSNNILEFSNTLDNCILSIKNEKKVETLTNIANLYSIIPKFEKDISAPNNIQNIKQTKSYIINAYSLVEQEKWEEINTNIVEADKTYKNLVNDLEYIKNKEYKVNRAYVLIKELQNSLSYKDRKLFYVKYKSLMENINTL